MNNVIFSLIFMVFGYVDFNTHFTSTKTTPTKKHNIKIGITVMGDVNKSDVELIKNNLIKFYNAEVVILPNTNLLTQTKVRGQNKYSANKILDSINTIFSKNDCKVLMLTNYNICTDRHLNGVTHKNWSIFGLAYIDKKPCVVSTNRLGGNKDKLIKTSIHEIGHTLGLPHCENDDCILTDAKGKGSRVDNMKIWMCENCKKKIGL